MEKGLNKYEAEKNKNNNKAGRQNQNVEKKKKTIIIIFALCIIALIYTMVRLNMKNFNETENSVEVITEKSSEKKDEVLNLNKTVYLTFDDGPTEWTTKIIDVLKRYDVKATFFITNPEGREEIVKNIYKEGHKIGVHSYSHSYSEIYKNRESFWNDVEKMQKEIQDITGEKTDIMRFAGGSKNVLAIGEEENILSKLKREVKSKGYEYFDWNVSAGDGGGALTDIDYITNNMIEGIKRNKTSIVLCHDTYENVVYGIENVIKWCNENEYKFRVIDKDEFIYHF